MATTKVRNSSTRKSATTTSNNEVLNNCIGILNLAIKKGRGVSWAAVERGFGKNYLSDVKMSLQERIDSGRFSKKDAATFRTLYNQYQRENA